MFTSHFGKVKEIEAAGLVPIAISIGLPRWFKGRRVTDLAPSWAMLKLSPEEYDARYDRILTKLDPKEIAKEIGDKGVMLCWEKPGEPGQSWDRCHRRRVAEWLEAALGIVISEFGFEREDVPAYSNMNSGLKKSKSAKPKKGRGLVQ